MISVRTQEHRRSCGYGRGRPRAVLLRSCLVAALGMSMSIVSCEGGTGSSSPQGSAPVTLASDVASACDLGATEGTLNYVATADPEIFAKEIAPFEKNHPKIKINYTALRPTDAAQRIIAEVQAHHTLDIDGLEGDIAELSPLFARDMIRDVGWSAYGMRSDLVLTVEGVRVFRDYRLPAGVVYNTSELKADEVPDTWDQVVDPKWAGKVVLDPRATFQAALALVQGKKKTVEWFKSFLSVDKPVIKTGNTAGISTVTSGQALMTVGSTVDNFKQQRSGGAPIGMKYLDIVPVSDYYVMIPKDSQHPNAALCFAEWWGGEQGVAQRTKYEFKPNDTVPTGMPPGAKVAAIESPADAELQASVAKTLSKLVNE